MTMICERPTDTVYPKTYEDTLDYLEGKRRVDKVQKGL